VQYIFTLFNTFKFYRLKGWLAGTDTIYGNGDDRRVYIRYESNIVYLVFYYLFE
jgi:hypothetical protein